MLHQKDQFGCPFDPELRRLVWSLGNLAAEWRGVARGADRQAEIAVEYLHILQQIHDLGWRGGLDIEDELPHRLMPKWYMEQDLIPSPARGKSDND